MSKTNTLNKKVYSTYNILSDLNRQVASDILKRLRFDYGNKKVNLYKEIVLINSILTDQPLNDYRADIIALALPKIKKL